ncbi:MAG: hypothetical protein QW620_05250 [Thermoplasmata archaeon]
MKPQIGRITGGLIGISLLLNANMSIATENDDVVCLLSFLLFYLTGGILIGLFIYRDIEDRGLDGLIWIVASILFPFVTYPLYFWFFFTERYPKIEWEVERKIGRNRTEKGSLLLGFGFLIYAVGFFPPFLDLSTTPGLLTAISTTIGLQSIGVLIAVAGVLFIVAGRRAYSEVHQKRVAIGGIFFAVWVISSMFVSILLFDIMRQCFIIQNNPPFTQLTTLVSILYLGSVFVFWSTSVLLLSAILSDLRRKLLFLAIIPGILSAILCLQLMNSLFHMLAAGPSFATNSSLSLATYQWIIWGLMCFFGMLLMGACLVVSRKDS